MDHRELVASTARQLQQVITLVQQAEIPLDDLAPLLDLTDEDCLRRAKNELARQRLLPKMQAALKQLAGEGIEATVRGMGPYEMNRYGCVELIVVAGSSTQTWRAHEVAYDAVGEWLGSVREQRA